MRFASTTFAVALAASSVSAAVPNIKDANKNILKGAYIVQFTDEKVSYETSCSTDELR